MEKERKITRSEGQEEGKEQEKGEDKGMKAWDCGSPLYDSYELASLGLVLERHMMSLPFPRGGSPRPAGGSRSQSTVSARHDRVAKVSSIRGGFIRLEKKNKKKKMMKKKRWVEERGGGDPKAGEKSKKLIKITFCKIITRIGLLKKCLS
ncbi:hypothetical protein NMG60_11028946 [Bertholletia excelsa]